MTKAFLLLLFATSFVCCGQSRQRPTSKPKIKSQKVGGACEGCEAIYSCPVSFAKLNWVDTLPDFNEPGPKLVISGTVYKQDGTTPAPGVVFYIYHTDQSGHYTNRTGEGGWAGNNGYIKGWIKTDAQGRYRFYTLKPAPYPGANIPAHIHPIVKEADKNEYYIDEYRFDDDPLLTVEERRKEEGRGGSGLLHLTLKGDILYGERNIILGKNISDYPKQ